MRFTVVWFPSSQSELARLWFDAPDRAAVAAAADLMDSALAQDAMNCGESRDAGSRVMFAHPLAMEFQVNEGDRVVTVIGIWRPRSSD
jgi:hypothetical protein